MRRSLLLATLLTAVAGAAWAQSPPTKDPAKIEGGAYIPDPFGHTQVIFAVNHLGFTTYYGTMSNVTGKLDLNPKNPADSKLEISIPVSSVLTTSTKLDGELKSADWLDADKYPAITFKATKISPAGGDKAKITGDLTLHGVTKPVTLDATLIGAGPNPMLKFVTVGFSATGTVKRSEFGVTKFVPYVSDDVTLMISAAFEKH